MSRAVIWLRSARVGAVHACFVPSEPTTLVGFLAHARRALCGRTFTLRPGGDTSRRRCLACVAETDFFSSPEAVLDAAAEVSP